MDSKHITVQKHEIPPTPPALSEWQLSRWIKGAAKLTNRGANSPPPFYQKPAVISKEPLGDWEISWWTTDSWPEVRMAHDNATKEWRR